MDMKSIKACRTRTVLTEKQALKIYQYKLEHQKLSRTEAALAARELAQQYSVTDKAIRDIWRGRTWRFETMHPLSSTGKKRPGRPKTNESPIHSVIKLESTAALPESSFPYNLHISSVNTRPTTYCPLDSGALCFDSGHCSQNYGLYDVADHNVENSTNHLLKSLATTQFQGLRDSAELCEMLHQRDTMISHILNPVRSNPQRNLLSSAPFHDFKAPVPSLPSQQLAEPRKCVEQPLSSASDPTISNAIAIAILARSLQLSAAMLQSASSPPPAGPLDSLHSTLRASWAGYAAGTGTVDGSWLSIHH